MEILGIALAQLLHEIFRETSAIFFRLLSNSIRAIKRHACQQLSTLPIYMHVNLQ